MTLHDKKRKVIVMKKRELFKAASGIITLGIMVALTACGTAATSTMESKDTTTEVIQQTEAASEATAKATEEKETTEVEIDKTKKEDFNSSDYRNDINYESLCRKPDDYMGMKIYMSGRVNSMLEEDDEILLQVDVGEGLVLVVVNPDILEVRILEEDQITFYGVFNGLGKYKTVAGQTVSDPGFVADHIDIDSYDDTAGAPGGELRVGQYKGTTTEEDFIYNRTADISYQDGEAYGCSIMVVREIVDRGDATILGNISGFLIETGEGEYTYSVEGVGTATIKAYDNHITITTFPEPGNEATFEGLDGDYEYVTE